MKDTGVPRFWRDATLPFVEARSIREGRHVGYAKHSHQAFSIGAITAGHCTYLNGKVRERVGAGSAVVINPEDVHACNPVDAQPLSYCMLYVDAAWLTKLQHELGFSPNLDFRAFSTTSTTMLFDGVNRLYAILTDEHADHLQKHSTAIAFFSEVQRLLDPAPAPAKEASHKLLRAAEFISENFLRSLKLDEICTAAGLSASYLIRSFNEYYGMTPHSYLMNRRIEYSREQLRRGHAIADVALEAGFSDQAHLQRAFKRYLAATPGQYRGVARELRRDHASSR